MKKSTEQAELMRNYMSILIGPVKDKKKKSNINLAIQSTNWNTIGQYQICIRSVLDQYQISIRSVLGEYQINITSVLDLYKISIRSVLDLY